MKTATKVWESGSSRLGTQRSALLLALRLTLGIVVFWVTATLVSWSSVYASLGQARGSYLVAAALLLIPNLWFQHLKWLQLLRASRADIRHGEAATSLLAGFALGLVTPGRLGEIGRGLFLRGRDKVETAYLAAIDKLTTLVIILGAGTVSLVWMLAKGGTIPAAWAFCIMVVALTAGLCVFCVAPGALYGLLKRAPLGRFRRELQRVNFSVWVRAGLRLRLLILGLSFAFYATFVLQFSLLVAAFTGRLSAVYPLAAAGALFIKTLVPISFGDIGIREGSAALVFSRVGIEPAAAFSGALLLFVVNVVLPAAFGTVLILGRRDQQFEAEP